MKARLLVIQHEDDCPPGWFGEWLDACGVELDVVAAHRGEVVPPRLPDHDGLLVLGGEMGAYDDARSPWLGPTRRLIADTVAEQLPFLGVCLGHQLAAAALGGVVARNPAGQAVGLTPIQLADEAADDPLLGAVHDGARAVQWNEDVVTELPRGSTPLAFAPDSSVQAARFGPVAWGVQFHPEVSPEIFAAWTVSAAGAARSDGVDPAVAAGAARDAREELRTAWRPLAERFAAVLQSAASAAHPVRSAAGVRGAIRDGVPNAVPRASVP